jgi:hypothetical protein
MGGPPAKEAERVYIHLFSLWIKHFVQMYLHMHVCVFFSFMCVQYANLIHD